MSTFKKEKCSPVLAKLAKKHIYLGTSSWIYRGWIGQVYTGDYSGKRSNFVKKTFEQNALREYAETFPTVCFDGAYYRFPDTEKLTEFYHQTPKGFKMALKVTDLLTIQRFPFVPKWGDKKGQLNPTFLDSETFSTHYLPLVLETLAEKLSPLIFEFTAMRFTNDFTPEDFVKQLDTFFKQAPKGEALYAVEVRNKELIHPDFGRYLDCLHKHHVSHVITEQTSMPALEDQIEVDGIYTAKHTVVRALVRPSVAHNDAVEEFEPYDRTQLTLPGLRKGLGKIVREAGVDKRQLFAYVNNRVEGNAPNTIAATLNLLQQLELNL